MTPSAQMSLRTSALRDDLSVSGDMYGGEPMMVPAAVAKLIKERGLFGYRRPESPPIEAAAAK